MDKTSITNIQDISQAKQIVKPEYSGELYRDYHDPNGYKIRCGYWYILNRRDYNGNVFYDIKVKKKTKSGDEISAKKPVSFFKNGKKCYPEDGMLIKPLIISEDFYYARNDQYNAVWTIVIRDWEEKVPKNQEVGEAVEEYRRKSFNMELDDADLPF